MVITRDQNSFYTNTRQSLSAICMPTNSMDITNKLVNLFTVVNGGREEEFKFVDNILLKVYAK